jgi:hypothetical protein
MLGFSAYKSLENACYAGYSLKRLVTGQRIVTIYQHIPASISTSEPKQLIPMITQKFDTLFGLFRDTLISAAWSSAWGAISYYTYQDMVDDLERVNPDLQVSQMIVLALGASSAALPCFLRLKTELGQSLRQPKESSA